MLIFKKMTCVLFLADRTSSCMQSVVVLLNLRLFSVELILYQQQVIVIGEKLQQQQPFNGPLSMTTRAVWY